MQNAVTSFLEPYTSAERRINKGWREPVKLVRQDHCRLELLPTKSQLHSWWVAEDRDRIRSVGFTRLGEEGLAIDLQNVSLTHLSLSHILYLTCRCRSPNEDSIAKRWSYLGCNLFVMILAKEILTIYGYGMEHTGNRLSRFQQLQMTATFARTVSNKAKREPGKYAMWRKEGSCVLHRGTPRASSIGSSP